MENEGRARNVNEFPLVVSRSRSSSGGLIVIGHHLIWTAYGWWLPNDPRGSSSTEIRIEKIAELGELHYGHKAMQPRSEELRRFYASASDALAHDPLCFTDEEIVLLGTSFEKVIQEIGYTCYACAIMPEHMHLLIRRHRDKAESMIASFQKASRNNCKPQWYSTIEKSNERCVQAVPARHAKIARRLAFLSATI